MKPINIKPTEYVLLLYSYVLVSQYYSIEIGVLIYSRGNLDQTICI